MPKFIVSEVVETRREFVVEAKDTRDAEDYYRHYKRTANGTAKGMVRFSSTESHIITKELRGVINND
ncbi:hypothetical protein HMPREF9372_3396 [Sporosarcina newyorkensis 2681]|uniref:Uncharacterized protein n=1 Tax=Sporosarcina newyorkensis 2681 TaxID=1027292 RepID=F9DX65_9BACL|nr:hypothetical protein [Sporosarcina newyorkensis]EGQ21113.1 hypothetical protein HMPREF9372_3396 [Sporosarcina newyorkensis 2681]